MKKTAVKLSQLEADRHPFTHKPNRTILTLSLPILLSLIAEPVTGLVDTAFVAQLGAIPLAALGVGASALSSVFWIFGFLATATQTDVAQTAGRGQIEAAGKLTSLALVMGLFISLLLCAILLPGAEMVSSMLGAEGAVLDDATRYMQLRLLGAPAVIVVIVGFGALRGVQDMRTPLWIALGINIANILLDYMFIFGWRAIPALGVAGAALASSLSHWLGAVWMLWELHRRLGLSRDIALRDGVTLLRVGRDLVIRSGSLTLFLLVATRVANQMGAEAGAAHQVIRQVWFFTALFVEAFATTAQSLVGYFYGSGQLAYAKRVAVSTMRWSLAAGVMLMFVMLAATPTVNRVLVPADALLLFTLPWVIASLSQPLNALAFITDGIHWGTGDYRFLRNAMLIATVLGLLGLQICAALGAEFFSAVWLVTVGWVCIRAIAGVLRVYPGIGNSPFRSR
ncbi:MAG: MATE family efflux transporter [Chloroflexi bacterium]|nr:MATE family efflux transporter [Chloroflexota bacterium]